MIRCTCAGLAGGIKLSNDPVYLDLKAKAAALPTLTDRLVLLGVSTGFYGPSTPDIIRRSTLARILIEDALADAADGDNAASVINAGLLGVPDKSLYTWYVPDGATIQDTVGTDLNVIDAVATLHDVDPGASNVVASGIATAGGAHVADYGTLLWEHFKQRFTDFANPFTNPLWGPAAMAALAIGAVLVLSRFARKPAP